MPLQHKSFFKIFDTKICPMLFYGSELWGLNHYEAVERVHTYACKRYMLAPIHAPNLTIYGDCGRFPMYIYTAKKVIKYWLRILDMPEYRYVKKCYNMMKLYDGLGRQNWVTFLRKHLYENGFGYVWEAQGISNEKLFLTLYLQRLKDQYLQIWYSNCTDSSKLSTYSLIKQNLAFEPYH